MKVSKQAGDGDAALGLWMMTRSHVALVLAVAGSLRFSQIAFEQRVLLLVTIALVVEQVRLACGNSSVLQS